jgi:hypothetical protein
MSPGGIIVVDDCTPGELWDGALQAYEEFVREENLSNEIAADKLDIVRAQEAHASLENYRCLLF